MTISDLHLECRAEEAALHKRIAELEAKIVKDREAIRHFLETISLAQRDTNAELDALNALAKRLEE